MCISPNWYYKWTLFVIYKMNPRCAANAGIVFTVFLSSSFERLRLCNSSKELSLRFNSIDFSKLKNSVLKGRMELNFQVLTSYKLK